MAVQTEMMRLHRLTRHQTERLSRRVKAERADGSNIMKTHRTSTEHGLGSAQSQLGRLCRNQHINEEITVGLVGSLSQWLTFRSRKELVWHVWISLLALWTHLAPLGTPGTARRASGD